MSPDMLLRHFDQISEAPDAIPRLRRFILDLAVRGKLVEQDPNDEPASELLKKIEAEKRQFTIRSRERSSEFTPFQNSSLPFSIPKNWMWVRLGKVIKLWNGFAFKSSDYKQHGIPVVRIGDLQNGQIILDSAVYVDCELAESIDDSVWIPEGALLIAMSGATTGKVAFNRTGQRLLLNQRVGRIQSFSVENEFLRFFFETIIQQNLSVSFGTAIPNLSTKQINETLFPLPPLAEQHRIVTKVNELMALCDELEASQAKRERRRDRLVSATLHALGSDGSLSRPSENNGIQSNDDFRNTARFYFNHLPRLTTHPKHIQQLRQTILDLAMRGKLVEQDLEDRSIDDLLEQILQEQTIVVKAGHLKRKVTSDNFKEFDGPHKLPKHWRWARLADLITFGPQNGVSPKPTNDDRMPKALTLTATTSGFLDPTYYKHVELPEAVCEEYWLYPGDVLFQRGNTREYVGIAAIYDGPPRLFVFPDLMIRVRFSQSLSLRYIHMALISPHARCFFSTKATGASHSMPKISQGVLLNAPIPLPPLAEQHRIVERVDELMAVCDELEVRIAEAAIVRRKLLEGIILEALTVRHGETNGISLEHRIVW